MLRCAFCGLTFEHYHDFELHKFHGHKPNIRALNISGRTKQEIVRAVEQDLKKYIIEANTGQHLEACTCIECHDDKWAKFIRGNQ